MTTTVSPQATITREEFDRTIEELRVEMRAVATRPPATGVAGLEPPREGFVRKDEFRLFKWFAGLALAAILSGFGLLYQGLAELRATTERQYSALQAEMDAGFRAARHDVDTRFTTLRRDITDVREQLVDVRERLADVRERLVRVETVLDVESRDDPGGASPKDP